MDERTSKLIGQLQQGLIDVSDSQIAEILRQAREEALAEARVILKDMMVQALLKQALDLEAIPTASPACTCAGTSEIPRAREAAAEHKTQIQQEIEAIRRKIAENEQSLSQLKTSPPAEPSPTSLPAPSEARQAGLAQAGLPAPFPDAEPDADEGDGYYVYGIVESKNGLPGDGWPEQGIDPAHPVYALPCRAIQAVVSQVSLKEFGEEPLKANLNNPTWLESRVRAHQSMLDTVAMHCTLIPMKFCTIYRSEGRVQEMLADYYDDFVAALGQLAGRQEWGVKVYLDRDTMERRVEETSERVGALKAELARKSSGKAYFAKKKLGETLAAEVEQLSDECAQKSHDRLAGCAEEARVNPLQSKEITSRKEEMVLNGVYLVDKGRVEAFRAELESLEKNYGHLGLDYELTGPWLPYNFVTIRAEEAVADE